MSEQTVSIFENSTYFILPIKIDNHDKFAKYLRENSKQQDDASKQQEDYKMWMEVFPVPKVPGKAGTEDQEATVSGPDGHFYFNPQYLMFYAEKMTNPSDNRFRHYIYQEPEAEDKKLNIYRLDNKNSGLGNMPTLGQISLYVFGQDIIFLEFQVLYNDMEIEKITSFIYSFRSLRDSSDKTTGSGCYSLKEAAERLLPEEQCGTILCFSNPSEIKMQANIFTMLNTPESWLLTKAAEENTGNKKGESDNSESENKPADLDQMCRRYCGRIAHGNKKVNPNDGDDVSDYDRCLHLNANEYWGICADGLAYVTNKEKDQIPFNTYKNLCNDFHFIYLLLLHQRFSAISFIEEISRIGKSNKERKKITEIYPNVVDLRTHYSFRVISDNFFVQTVYSNTYQVLEIESLLRDLEDANGQYNELSKEREKRVEGLVGVLSLLAVFSAVADLGTVLKEIPLPVPYVISTLCIVGIVAILLYNFKPWKR